MLLMFRLTLTGSEDETDKAKSIGEKHKNVFKFLWHGSLHKEINTTKKKTRPEYFHARLMKSEPSCRNVTG